MPNITARLNRIAALLAFVILMSRAMSAEVAPIVSATLNGSVEAVLAPGQPGIFEVEIMHPDFWEDVLEPIRLEQAGGVSWTNALKWSVRNAADAEMTWPLSMAPVTSTSIVLDRDFVGNVFLLLSPEATLAIPVGNYAVEFALDTRPDAAEGAWLGIARSIEMDIRVELEPAQLTASEIARRQTQLARYHALRSDFDTALMTVNLLLATQPRSQEGLRAKATLLEMVGNFQDALAVLENAVGIFAEDFPNAPEPPRDILKLRRELTTLAAAGLKVTSAALSNRQFTIAWEGETGKQYRVESSSDFVTWRVDASGITVFNWSGSIGSGIRFFRIVVE